MTWTHTKYRTNFAYNTNHLMYYKQQMDKGKRTHTHRTRYTKWVGRAMHSPGAPHRAFQAQGSTHLRLAAVHVAT